MNCCLKIFFLFFKCVFLVVKINDFKISEASVVRLNCDTYIWLSNEGHSSRLKAIMYKNLSSTQTKRPQNDLSSTHVNHFWTRVSYKERVQGFSQPVTAASATWSKLWDNRYVCKYLLIIIIIIYFYYY